MCKPYQFVKQRHLEPLKEVPAFNLAVQCKVTVLVLRFITKRVELLLPVKQCACRRFVGHQSARTRLPCVRRNLHEQCINLYCYIGLFQKKITFLVRKFQKFCVWLLTLYAFIICQVIIRTQYYTNASLISAPVVILYQYVRGA